MRYKIESHGRGNAHNPDWSEDYVTNDPAANRFDTEAEAWEGVRSLQAMGDDWTGHGYRVVEADET